MPFYEHFHIRSTKISTKKNEVINILSLLKTIIKNKKLCSFYFKKVKK